MKFKKTLLLWPVKQRRRCLLNVCELPLHTSQRWDALSNLCGLTVLPFQLCVTQKYTTWKWCYSVRGEFLGRLSASSLVPTLGSNLNIKWCDYKRQTTPFHRPPEWAAHKWAIIQATHRKKQRKHTQCKFLKKVSENPQTLLIVL